MSIQTTFMHQSIQQCLFNSSSLSRGLGISPPRSIRRACDFHVIALSHPLNDKFISKDNEFVVTCTYVMKKDSNESVYPQNEWSLNNIEK